MKIAKYIPEIYKTDIYLSGDDLLEQREQLKIAISTLWDIVREKTLKKEYFHKDYCETIKRLKAELRIVEKELKQITEW